MLLQCICFAGCLPVSLRVFCPAFRKRGPSGRSPSSGRLSKKKLSKKLRKTFGSLKTTPYLCTRFWEANPGAGLRKKLRKKFGKSLEDMLKTPYLCNRFPLKTEASRKSGLWWDLHKQYSSTRAKLETVSGKQKNRQYLYNIGNELLIRNPDRANDRPYPARGTVIKRYFYNEEFDPGSGWTLATGLTHASRGAAGLKLASTAGDRRTGE